MADNKSYTMWMPKYANKVCLYRNIKARSKIFEAQQYFE